MSAREEILQGRTSLGIELGSTRIKACLVGEDPNEVLATGGFDWENRLVGGLWSYPLEEVWGGIQAAVAALFEKIEARYSVRPTTFGAIGVSAMMHGYLAFDSRGELLVPFRTWRNTNTGAATAELFTGHLSEGSIRLYKREEYVESRREQINDDLEFVHLTKNLAQMIDSKGWGAAFAQ